MFLFGSLFVLVVANGIGVGLDRALVLYFWHSLFCLLYAFYVSAVGGDALMYYLTSLEDDLSFSVGTAFVRYLTSFFSSGLGLSFVSVFLVFNVFGSVGLLAFDASLAYAVRYKSLIVRQVVSFVVFLPSISFWSSAIGKDSIVFMGVCLALWSALDFRRRIITMAVAILFVFLVRPHIAGLMVVALASSFVFSNKLSFATRLGLGGFGTIVSIAAVPFALQYVGFGEVSSLNGILEYLDERQSYNQEGGGGVDISQMPFWMQLFTYMFRPLPFEVHNIASLVASLENVILLFLFIFSFLFFTKRHVVGDSENQFFLWVYALAAWVVLAITTANLGISVRQKWMFLPVILFFLLSRLGRNRLQK